MRLARPAQRRGAASATKKRTARTTAGAVPPATPIHIRKPSVQPKGSAAGTTGSIRGSRTARAPVLGSSKRGNARSGAVGSSKKSDWKQRVRNAKSRLDCGRQVDKQERPEGAVEEAHESSLRAGTLPPSPEGLDLESIAS